MRPKQKVTNSERTEDWKIQSLDYYRQGCVNGILDINLMTSLYNFAAGKLQESDYFYVTNPLGATDPKLKSYPARMRNYDILSSSVMLLMGERVKRNINYTVVPKNVDHLTPKTEELHKSVLDYITQEYINQLQLDGQDLSQYQQEDLVPPISKEKAENNLLQELSIMGQDALDYIKEDCFVDEKSRLGWYHFITISRNYTYRDILKGDIIYDIVPPHELKYLSSNDLIYIEDAEAVCRSTKMLISEIVDKFQGVEGFTDAVINSLENLINYGTNGFLGHNQLGSLTYSEVAQAHATKTLLDRTFSRTDHVYGDGISVEHVVWTSFKKVGKRTNLNMDGTVIFDYVSEDYIKSEDEIIDWQWANVKWEGYCLNNEYKIGIREIPYSVCYMDNPSKCKNPYNGKIFNTPYTEPISIVQKGIPYQIKYNIVHYHIEKLMAKNKDKMTIFPIGLFPNKPGWNEQTAMYYADATGFLFIDETNRNAIAAMQYVKVLDASVNQYIEKMYGYLQQIKEEWYDIIGITPQRKGSINQSAGKATTEAAIYRGSLITEEYFTEYDELINRDMNYLVSLSQFAWIGGKKEYFRNSQYKTALLNIIPEKYSLTEFGIFAKSSPKELEKLDAMKSLAQAFAQNDRDPSAIAKIFDAENISKLIEDLEDMERDLEAKQQQAQQGEQQVEQMKLEASNAKEDKITERQKELAYIQQDTATQVALIGVEKDLGLSDLNGDGKITEGEIEKNLIEREKLLHSLREGQENRNIEREKLRSKEKTEKQKNDTALKIAKTNRNKYSK